MPESSIERPSRRQPAPFATALSVIAAFGLLSAASAHAVEGGSKARAPVENVVVTGTRLDSMLIEGAYPVTSIDREQLLQSGSATIGELLQQLPFVGGSPISTGVSSRGSGGGFSRGIETIELRALGEQRTLVLLNGRRFVPGGNGASGVVDLGMIPVAWLERVEILKTGASVEYGADAVAGVINFITRVGFEGAEVQAAGGATSRGDGAIVSMHAVAGGRFGRAHLMAGLQASEQSAVSKGDRGFSQQLLTVSGPDNTIVPGGSSAPPGGNFRTSAGRLTLIDGASGSAPDDFRPFISEGPDSDRFNFNPFEDLVQDSRRLSAFLDARFTLTDNIELFSEALLHQRDSDQQIAPLPLFTTREQDVLVDADNLFNPFGETISDARRRLIEAGPRQFVQDNRSWRVVLGATGEYALWGWDASVNHGSNRIEQRQTGDVLDDRLRAALGPSFLDASGNAVCGRPEAPIPDCVPLNLFGGEGTVTDAMLRNIGADLEDFASNEQTIVSANLRGQPLELWAGPLSLASGYEFRREEGLDRPDPQTVAGNTSGAARAVTRGAFEASEVYVEFGVPLLAERRFARALELDAGMRYINYTSFDSRTVFDIGLHFQPVDALTLRAAFSEAFRPPNIGELFGGATQSNPAIADPCADFASLTPAQIQRCIDQGVPADGSFTQTGNETPQLGGGNPLLSPEEADVFTAGVTFRAPLLDGLELSLDYYDITIDDAISSLGGNTVLSQCLATGDPTFCQRIERDAQGDIVQITTTLQNIARETARGIDTAITLAHRAGGGGLTHRLTLSRVLERDLIAFAGADPFVGVGEFDPDRFGAIPRWRGSFRLGWERGPWLAGYSAQWIGPLQERGGELAPGTARGIPARLYHDVFAAYAFECGTQIRLGVDNLTDEDPPFFANADAGNTDVATYRLLGTRVWLRLTHAFGAQ
jgi:iron complex outermembrane receptor protein